ncbi:MAG: dihydrofolate reductase [Spirochaetaceae bacterium]|nr:dihydrofolate reductase [Spirochaetaceae bacterium]
MEIIIIVAVSENNVIGSGNAIPWHIREDMLHFKKLTTGWPCIMGRKTYESLPKRPLPGRENIVLSRSAGYHPTGAVVFPSLEKALSLYKGKSEKIFICGGQAVYSAALPLARKIEMTRVHTSVMGDVFFPAAVLDMSEWVIAAEEAHREYSFITYVRV